MKCGLAKKPATIYPSTTGWRIHLNTTVTTAPKSSINAKSEMRLSMFIVVCILESLWDLRHHLCQRKTDKQPRRAPDCARDCNLYHRGVYGETG